MIENAESIAQWAMEIADGLPEKYQQAAFAELLKCVLNLKSSPTGQGVEKTRRLINKIPDDHLVATEGSRDQQTVWAVMRLWEQGEEATPAGVINIIKARLRMQPESRSNTSGRLADLTPRYLMREEREEGRGYAHKPTPNAVKIFEGLQE